jgi:hypothetical protein
MNREQWLNGVATEVAPMFEMAGHPLPQVRMTCGFPSTHRRSGTLGECWSDKASGDGTFEIMISPTVADSGKVLTVLLAQLCLASKADPLTIGLDASGDLADGRWLDLLQEMGDYPHAAITIGERPVQTTRMLKAVCPSCKYHVRLTAKWARVGMPICPVHEVAMVLEVKA